jgi:hypothetical protein
MEDTDYPEVNLYLTLAKVLVMNASSHLFNQFLSIQPLTFNVDQLDVCMAKLNKNSYLSIKHS